MRGKFLAVLLLLIAVVTLVGLWPYFVTENQSEQEVTSMTVGDYSSSTLIAPTYPTYMLYDIDYSETHTVWISSLGSGGSFLLKLTEPSNLTEVKLNGDNRPFIPVDNATHVIVSTVVNEPTVASGGYGTTFIVRKSDMKIVESCPKVPTALWAAGFDENGDIWFGTYFTPIYYLNGTFYIYKLHGNCQWSRYGISLEGQPFWGLIRGLYAGSIWFLAQRNGTLVRFNIATHIFTKYVLGPEFVGGGVIDRVKGNVWISGSNLLYRFNIATNRIDAFNFSRLFRYAPGSLTLYGDKVVFTILKQPAAYLFDPTLMQVTSVSWTPYEGFAWFGGNGNQVQNGGKVYFNTLNGYFNSPLAVFDFSRISSVTIVTTTNSTGDGPAMGYVKRERLTMLVSCVWVYSCEHSNLNRFLD